MLPHAPSLREVAAFLPEHSSSSSAPSLFSAAGRTHPRSERGWIGKRAKFVVRSLFHYRSTKRWLGTLAEPDVLPLWTLRPRISTKLQRPYLSATWKVEERLHALLSHYEVMRSQFSTDALVHAYGDGLTMMRLHHEGSGRTLQVRLIYRNQFEKEGDLTLAIEDTASTTMLAGITFCVTTHQAAGRRILIGGLQAGFSTQTRELIHDVAKEMHGMRPKALALWCLQELGALWSVSEILAVADSAHIYRHSHKRREFAASYDEFWTESDGEKLENGFWRMPLRLRHRSREELKPSRRKAHERRYAMLTELQAVLAQRVGELRNASSDAAGADRAPQHVYSLPGDKASAAKPRVAELAPVAV